MSDFKYTLPRQERMCGSGADLTIKKCQDHKVAVYEAFFNQIYMNYAVCLNQDKVKEALELIYKFCAQPNYATDEELAEKRERVIKMMEDWR